MKCFAYMTIGVPIRQTIETVHDSETGYVADNLYLVKLMHQDHSDHHKIVHKQKLHLFTTKELINATERYYRDLGSVISAQPGAMTGYTYPITYKNRNGILTTRYFFKFNGSHVEELNQDICCGLFSAREMIRSNDRAEKYFGNHTILDWIKKGLKCIVGK